MDHTTGHERPMQKFRWRSLLLMALLSFISMFALMYMMVDTWANVLPNVNQVYMAGLMTAPMMIIEMVLMGAMYGDRRVTTAVIAVSAGILALFTFFVRGQVGVTDRAFLRSMIPHHGAALLMCKEAPLQDPEIKDLCESIIASQQSEIDWMRAKLAAMDSRR